MNTEVPFQGSRRSNRSSFEAVQGFKVQGLWRGTRSRRSKRSTAALGSNRYPEWYLEL